MPFPVSVGGQAASAKAGEPFARLEKPVAANAAIEVGAKSDMTIINVTAYDTVKKEPVAGGATAIIMLQGTQKGSLDKNMGNHKLTTGDYLMSVVAGGATDTVLFKVQ